MWRTVQILSVLDPLAFFCYRITMVLEETEDLISIEDYLAGELVSEIKHEFLGGAVHAMAGGTMGRNLAASNTHTSLGKSIKGKRCRPFNSDTKVRIKLPSQIRFYHPGLSAR